ncbi:hypothetical protein E2C01_089623 [Portunus trituberculatus]|uniref:Uncharacterized protein n=1 Tax=Portunus trituberculatus TaxID=210409 RepID=A0A5B7JE17_PORTR|nr:hypothetical protein [Portunus trituberculatus]
MANTHPSRYSSSAEPPYTFPMPSLSPPLPSYPCPTLSIPPAVGYCRRTPPGGLSSTPAGVDVI